MSALAAAKASKTWKNGLKKKGVKELEGDKGPILISIGPQCSGKTTFFESLNEKYHDYAMDDVPQMYEKVIIFILMHE